MKNRKHKNNRRFVISYQTQYRSSSGKTRFHPKAEISIVTDSKGGALNAFRFGIDANNTRIFSVEELPL